MPAHRLVLAVAPLPLAVLVALVRGDVDHDAHVARSAHGVEHVHGAHHVGLVGLARVEVGAAHERLRGHVDDDLRPRPRDRRARPPRSRARPPRSHSTASPTRARLVQRRLVGTSSERPVTPRAERRSQSDSQLALEARVAGQQHAAPAPEVRIYVLIPRPPGRAARLPELLELVAVAQRVHRAARSPRGGTTASSPSRGEARAAAPAPRSWRRPRCSRRPAASRRRSRRSSRPRRRAASPRSSHALAVDRRARRSAPAAAPRSRCTALPARGERRSARRCRRRRRRRRR